MRLGFFGGTFDPPHLGHLILAAEALDQLKLDCIYWVLTPLPPHKKNLVISPVEQRLELLQAALSSDPSFEISRIDIDRPPPHFAFDTMDKLKSQFPGDELIYLMGGDSLHDLPIWYHPQRFLAACNSLGVMRRPGDQIDLELLKKSLPEIGEKVQFIDTPLLEISSKQIRERICNGGPFRYFLPDAVYKLILQKKLYQ